MGEAKSIHYHREPIRRAKGQAACACASYRAAEPIFDERLQQRFYIKNNDGLVPFSKIIAPPGAPPELLDRESLWNNVEASERAEKAQVAEEFEAGLPIELDRDEQIALIEDFCQDYLVSRGIICDVNLHAKEGNPHFHVMMPHRAIDHSRPTKLAARKDRDWFRIGTIAKDRIAICACINKHLKMSYDSKIASTQAEIKAAEKLGLDTTGLEEKLNRIHLVKYDHRTLKERGIDRLPGIHIGATASGMEKRNIEKVTRLFKEQCDNPDSAENKAKLEKIVSEIQPVSDRGIMNQNIINLNKAKAAKAKAEKERKEAEERKKAEAEASSKRILQRQMLRDYHESIGVVRLGLKERQGWREMKPIKPVLDTLEGSKHEKNMGLWKDTGKRIRAIIHGTIQSIRGLTSDYLGIFDRDIKSDAENMKESGAIPTQADITPHEINGP